jgi:hypothetical protein
MWNFRDLQRRIHNWHTIQKDRNIAENVFSQHIHKFQTIRVRLLYRYLIDGIWCSMAFLCAGLFELDLKEETEINSVANILCDMFLYVKNEFLQMCVSSIDLLRFPTAHARETRYWTREWKPTLSKRRRHIQTVVALQQGRTEDGAKPPKIIGLIKLWAYLMRKS